MSIRFPEERSLHIKLWVSQNAPSLVTKIAWGVITLYALVFTSLQLSGISNILSRHMDNAGIIASYSVDAGTAIAVAGNTTFFNDNGWRPYGPVYYRLAYFLYKTSDQLIGQDLNASPAETKQEKLHFYLLLVSAFSIFGISYLTSSLLTNSWQLRLISAALLTSTILNNDLWVTLIWATHPDISMAFFSGLFSFYVARFFFMQNPPSWYPIALGIIGGIGLSTKLIFGIIIFPTFLLLAFPLGRESIKKIFLFGFAVFLTFFLVGFPQNFKLLEIFDFLQKQSAYGTPPTIESVNHWVALATSQLRPFLIALAGLTLVLVREPNPCPNKFQIKKFLVLIPFWLIPWAMLFSLNFKLSVDYYILPFLSSSIIVLALLLRIAANSITLKFFKSANPIWKIAGPITLIMFILIRVDLIPPRAIDNGMGWLKDRRAIHEIYGFGYNAHKENKFVLRDPYFPYPNISNSALLDRKSVEAFLKPGKAHYLMLSSKWFDRFLEDAPSPYDLAGVGKEEWDYMHKFYTTLFAANGTSNIYGKTYKLIHKGGDTQVWELIPEH